jgi:hypothetical protein
LAATRSLARVGSPAMTAMLAMSALSRLDAIKDLITSAEHEE